MAIEAEFYNELAEGPEGGAAWWLTTNDDVRIRIGGWGAGAPNGTILLFPGRTEYIEKYGRSAQEFLDKGFATLAVDWRGQGLADRLIEDRQKGHVDRFQDYQKDVAALVKHAETLGYKKPYYLVAHSMGGCIGYRALHQGLPVQAAVFTGPMWGIVYPPLLKPFAPMIARVGNAFGLGGWYVPTGSNDNYVQIQQFEGNSLTTDPSMYAYMQGHLNTQPELGLGGPTLHWLDQAIDEINFIMSSDAPKVPTRCYIGTAEKIVDSLLIHKRMANWPGAELIEISMAEHEVLMETPEIRHRVIDEICAFFAKHPA